MQVYDWMSNDESVIFEGAASKQWNIKGINLPGNKGGKLILTNKQLVFQAHAINLGTHLDKIPLKNITSAEKGFSPLIPNPNTIKIETRLGEKYMIIVMGNDMEKWLESIPKAVAECSNATEDNSKISNISGNEYKCMSCGYISQKPFKFCPECGEPVNTEQKCPGCGAVVDKGQKFCTECVQSLL